MKITITVNDKPVEIELTADQVQAVKKQTEKITDRVKTFEDACEVLGVYPNTTLHVTDKLKTIVTALNEGWTPDWQSNEYKYTIYWKEENSRFVFYDCLFWCRNTSVGSRLCFKSSALAQYCATQFEDLWNEFLR